MGLSCTCSFSTLHIRHGNPQPHIQCLPACPSKIQAPVPAEKGGPLRVLCAFVLAICSGANATSAARRARSCETLFALLRQRRHGANSTKRNLENEIENLCLCLLTFLLCDLWRITCFYIVRKRESKSPCSVTVRWCCQPQSVESATEA